MKTLENKGAVLCECNDVAWYNVSIKEFYVFQPTDADRCFEDHPKTDISLQLAIYYYALQIYSSVRPCSGPDLHPLYTHPPVKVMHKVVSLVTQKTDFDWPAEVKELVEKIKQYNEMLEDYRQGKVLRKLGRGG